MVILRQPVRYGDPAPTGGIGGESIAPETLVKQKIALAVWAEGADIAKGNGSYPRRTFGHRNGCGWNAIRARPW